MNQLFKISKIRGIVNFLLPFVLAFAFLSCQKEEVQPEKAAAPEVESDVLMIPLDSEIITPDMLPYLSSAAKNIVDEDIFGDVSNGRIMATQQQILGPFTGTASLTRIVNNGRYFLSGFPGIAAGIYFCDVFSSEFSVTVQPGQFPILQGASRVGYSDFINRVEGIITTTVGQTTTYITRSIIIRTNVLGQQINAGPFPRDLTGNQYTYSILTLH